MIKASENRSLTLITSTSGKFVGVEKCFPYPLDSSFFEFRFIDGSSPLLVPSHDIVWIGDSDKIPKERIKFSDIIDGSEITAEIFVEKLKAFQKGLDEIDQLKAILKDNNLF